MSDTPPTLSDYEELMDGDGFDLDGQDLDRETINTELERLFTSQ
ncbi:hypothetical protein RBH26_11050 [Natronolimnohabitans sp. A-GB9]|nr:hypothetical protein [Natronolimnohabitans sp. A-GB9]MDQ2051017.1 hypothetical protein [Natronolimnohabitans sp. A-GB9]